VLLVLDGHEIAEAVLLGIHGIVARHRRPLMFLHPALLAYTGFSVAGQCGQCERGAKPQL
jgi:hypothetical protein